ncbi:MAG: DNA repair protein RecO [Thermoanaerobaculia bacterium]
MKFHQSEALILEVSDLAEADRIVVFLTREEGKRRGVARGAKRRFSRFAGELQPLAKARIGWMEKEGRDLVRIGSVELLRPVKVLQQDLEGILLGATIAEQVGLFAQEGEASEVLFRLLDSTIEALESGRDRDLVARYFESWLLRSAGIFPPPIECPLCGRSFEGGAALPASGEGLICRECARGASGVTAVSPGAVQFWRRIGRENIESISADPPSVAVLAEVAAAIGQIRRHFLQHEVRSLAVMERTLESIGSSRSSRSIGAGSSTRSVNADSRPGSLSKERE